MAQQAFQNVLKLERRAQASIFNLFNTQLGESTPDGAPSSEQPASSEKVVLTPVDVNGFYNVTGPSEVTFYVTTDTPIVPVGQGWSAVGITGIMGQIRVTGTNMTKGPGYNWSFTLQSDTDQSIEGTQQATGAILYPPSQIQYQTNRVRVPIYGYYTINSTVQLYFTAPPPQGLVVGWIVTGLPTFSVPLKVTSVSLGVGDSLPFVTLEPVSGNIPVSSVPIYVNGVPAMIQEPLFTTEFVPGKFTNYTSPSLVLPNVQVSINSNVHVTGGPEQRDLNTNVAWSQEVEGRLFPENEYKEVKGKGFSSGSVLALQAIGPQDAYLMTDDMSRSEWNPEFKRYSNFVMYQKVYPFPPPNPSYQGQSIQIELRPTELGHLLSNMYLSVTLPALPNGKSYTPNVGRALIKQVDLLVNETVVETLYDDWYIIRDQLFLDADENLGLQQALNVSNAQVQNTITIPLEFFFCRRHSHYNKGRERLRKPYFPVCAMWNQRLYVRFTFQPDTWWCNATGVDIYPAGTSSWPNLITEEILLENEEKLYYQHTPLKYIVNRVQKESTLPFSSESPALQLTANYPVQVLAWFFRNKNYEKTTDNRFFQTRYSYGYTTQYIQTGIELQFPSGNSNFVDVINNAKITLNNVDILSTFQGSLYYSFKQPMEHYLSVPSKNIYLYSFGLTPKEYNQGGYLNFSKLNSQTTYIQLNFNPTYTTQLIQGYNLYLFYYGYSLLQFQGGFASLPFL
jgi:Large eukaryotic DNA virus major capsid protein/Major capsid protein N-terminus